MGFSAEAIAKAEAARERQALRDKWICNPGLHVVTIVAWGYVGACRGKDVAFELRDDADRQQFVRFSLSVCELRNGELLRFIVAAMNWQPEVHAGEMFAIANRKHYDQLVGRRLAVAVVKDARGLHSVVDWEPVSE